MRLFYYLHFQYIWDIFVVVVVVVVVVVQLLSHIRLFVTPWTSARQFSLSVSNSWSLLKLMSIESAMPSDHFIVSSPSASALNLSQHQGLFQ